MWELHEKVTFIEEMLEYRLIILVFQAEVIRCGHGRPVSCAENFDLLSWDSIPDFCMKF